MNRLVCLRWTPKTQRKEKFFREPQLARWEPSRLSQNCNLEHTLLTL
jgi:hypothetical protein